MSSVRPAWIIALSLLLLAGCATRAGSNPGGDWLSPRHRDHPLVGRAWDVRQQRFVELAAVEEAARGADYLLLGENHDNADHHLLQARLLGAVTGAGRRPAVAFEMLEVTVQPQVDAVLASGTSDPDAVGRAVDWAKSGWPPFELYRPIFAAALEAKLPLVAASLPKAQVRAAVREGPAALDPKVQERLARAGPLPDAQLADLREELRKSHCGALPEAMIDPMVLAQRARDVQLASRMVEAQQGQGVVLIAGSGHVRTDRGVPALLAEDQPQSRVLAVGLVEVTPEASEPAAYAPLIGGGTLPFDFLLFTPAAEREDPCAALRGRAHPPVKTQ